MTTEKDKAALKALELFRNEKVCDYEMSFSYGDDSQDYKVDINLPDLLGKDVFDTVVSTLEAALVPAAGASSEALAALKAGYQGSMGEKNTDHVIVRVSRIDYFKIRSALETASEIKAARYFADALVKMQDIIPCHSPARVNDSRYKEIYPAYQAAMKLLATAPEPEKAQGDLDKLKKDMDALCWRCMDGDFDHASHEDYKAFIAHYYQTIVALIDGRISPAPQPAAEVGGGDEIKAKTMQRLLVGQDKWGEELYVMGTANAIHALKAALKPEGE